MLQAEHVPSATRQSEHRTVPIVQAHASVRERDDAKADSVRADQFTQRKRTRRVMRRQRSWSQQ
jgi:hypothetical protein